MIEPSETRSLKGSELCLKAIIEAGYKKTGVSGKTAEARDLATVQTHQWLAARVQTVADGLRQFLRRERFGEEIDIFRKGKILADDFGAVAAHVDHFQFGIFLQETLRQVFSDHAVRHHQIGQQQTDFIPVLLPDFQCFDAGGRFKNAIAKLRQRFAHGNAQGRVVFRQQNGFVAAAQVRQRRRRGF